MRVRPLVRTWPGLVGVGAIGASLWWLVGPPGIVAGLAVLVGWVVLPTPYVIALAHLLLVVYTASWPATGPLVAFEAGVIGVVLAPLARDAPIVDAVVGTVVVTGFVGLVIAGLAEGMASWLVAGGLVVAVALVAYAIHRVELVRLGLVSTG